MRKPLSSSDSRRNLRRLPDDVGRGPFGEAPGDGRLPLDGIAELSGRAIVVVDDVAQREERTCSGVESKEGGEMREPLNTLRAPEVTHT